MPSQCKDCGARYPGEQDSCVRRFDNLLALDHSRLEPWASRHGLAFAVYALQHPSAFPSAVLNQAWRILYRVYVAGDNASRVLHALAGRPPAISAAWDVPPRPERATSYPKITIVDLGDFPAEQYPAMLDSWCEATVTWLAPPRT
jgi:hypothetical protein